MSILSGFNKVKNYVKTTEGYKLLSRWTSSDTVDVYGKTLTEVVNELGTASKKDVAASGNASTTQVVMGNDTRLTDARKASDVSAWAKASTKPTYTKDEVGLGNVGNFKAVSTVASQGLTDAEKSNARTNIGAQVAGSYASSTHNHDDRYYTETEINTKLNGKANSSHTHGNGDITSLDASKITSGTISIDRLPQGALERLTVVADDTARFKLTSSTIQKGDTVKVTSTGKMYYVVDETKLSTEAGYEVYATGTATSVPWSGVTGKPSTYTPSSHTHTKSQITDFPTSMPANGGNSSTVNGHTVGSDVPSNAVFTDTVYDDSAVKASIQNIVNGTTQVGNATKATQDAQGNIINETYAKKTEIPQGTVVDNALSSTSTNPVQNKVVKAEFDKVTSNLQEQINNSQTQISNDPSNIITKKIDGIFAEEPFITVPTQTDASLDATAAVQTALTKALLTGKNLFFPKGIYTISDRLIISKSIKVFGASREDTVIKFTGTAKETTPYNPQYYDESNAAILIQAFGVEIADLTIEGGTSNTDTSDCYGIAMHRILTKNDKTNYEGAERVALTNVEIRYFKTGLFMFGGWNRYITRCYFRDNAEYGVKYYPLEADSIGNWAGSGDVYIACQFVANLFAGFYAKGLFETTIWNSIFEYNKRAIEVDRCTDICFKNCWNEANIENLKVTGNCRFEGGYNINHRTVDHTVVGGNDLVIFENETLTTMYRAGNVVFSQTAGIITKGVEIGVEVDNLLANPGFSEASGGTGTIPSDVGWYHEGTFKIIEDNPNYVSLSNEGAETDVYRGMWTTQEIALAGNTKYNIAAWIKTPDRRAIDSTGIMFYISWKTADGVTILNDNRTIILAADNTWEYHELQVEAPKGAAFLKVGYGLTRNGHVYFREPEVSVVGSITSSNIYVRKDNSDSNIIKFVDINGNGLGSINLRPETTTLTTTSGTATLYKLGKMRHLVLNNATFPSIRVLNSTDASVGSLYFRAEVLFNSGDDLEGGSATLEDICISGSNMWNATRTATGASPVIVTGATGSVTWMVHWEVE